jgi:ribosome-associated translation inhibitor RaiA
MRTTITARHCDIPDALRERAVRVAERLGSLASRPVDAAIIFEADGPGRLVELRLHDSRGELFVARGEAPDHRTALDRAEEKLRRQLEKANGRPRRSRPTRSV